MTLPLALLFLIVALFVIAKSADLMVATATRLARKFGVSDFSMGFFVLGMATTTPELFVGIQAALAGEPHLSLGNLIGATIVLLTLVIGLSAVMNGEVHFIKSFEPRDIWLMSFVIVAPIFLLFDGTLTRYDGLLLIVLYALFYIIMNQRQTFAEKLGQTLENHNNHIGKTIGYLVLGIVGLAISSKVIVMSAESIAVGLALPLVLVGLLILAIGTNLPEITLLLTTIKQRHKQIGIGDFLGSAVANTPTLGIVALIHPIQLEAPLKVLMSLGMLVLVVLMFNAFFSIDKKISRIEGLALISLYAFFLFSELFLKNQL